MSDSIVVNITPPPPISLAYTQGGAVGPQGATGSTGLQGPANKLVIGSVVGGQTAAATLTAQVVANGTASQTLSLVLPQGATGERGLQGEVGPAGPPNSLTVGDVSVTTAATAAVTITGNSPSQTISFVVPRGPQGIQGETGPSSVVQAGTVTTGASGTQAKVDAVTSGGTVTLNFTIPRGQDGTSNLGDETPQPLGVASAGSAVVAARADHRHPLQVVSFASLTGVPTTFSPSAHTHAVSEVTNLQALLDSKQPAGAYATLVGGTVPSSMLPSFVDDVREAASLSAFPATGDSGVIYVAVDTKKIWRWSGSTYVEIAASPGSTDAVPEGATNLYHTTQRAAAAAPVQSVAGRTGAVTIVASDISGLQASLDSKLSSAVTSLNSLAGAVSLKAGANVTISTSGSEITIASSGGGGGGGSETEIYEYEAVSNFPSVGQSGRLYIATSVSRVFRWDTSGVYVELGPLGSGGGGSGGGGGGGGTDISIYFVPSAPTNVSVAPGNSQAVLTWNASSAISQIPVNDYIIQYSSNNGSTWTTFPDGTATATTATVTGLTNETSYVFRVAGVNGAGAGPWSSTASATPNNLVFRPIPIMTDDTSPSGQASASPVVGGAPYNAFDNNELASVVLGTGSSPMLLQYDFGAGVASLISGYSIKQGWQNGDRFLQEWVFEGSNDGVTYVTLDSRSNQQWTTNVQTFSLASTVAYRMFRLRITGVAYNSGSTHITSFQLLA